MKKEEIDFIQKIADKNKQMSQDERKEAGKRFKRFVHGSPKIRIIKALKELGVTLISLFTAYFYFLAFNEGNVENMRLIGFLAIPFIIAGVYFFWKTFYKN